MEFEIREAREADLPAMCRLWREMMDFHAELDDSLRPRPSPHAERVWEHHMRASVLGNEKCCTIVAAREDGLIGMIIGELRESYPVLEPELCGYVSDAVVTAPARRQGVGRALFEAAVGWAREQGCTSMQVGVSSSNPVSQAFWRAMGCTEYRYTLSYQLEVE